jgi:DNA-binding NtrC family response regulator
MGGIMMPAVSNFRNLGERLSRRVIVIEDDFFWQKIISKSLHKYDPSIDIETFTTAEEAIDYIDYTYKLKDEIHFIVCDLKLKGGDSGMSVLDHIEQEELGIPFLIISGLSRREIIFETLPRHRGNLPEIVNKPLSVSELVWYLQKIDDCS